MKRIAVLVAFAALPCLPALTYAQGDKPAAAAPAAKPAEKPVTRTAGRSRDTRDATGCLQLATNTEIIKCAEKYL
jgi:hypothetical protein